MIGRASFASRFDGVFAKVYYSQQAARMCILLIKTTNYYYWSGNCYDVSLSFKVGVVVVVVVV